MALSQVAFIAVLIALSSVAGCSSPKDKPSGTETSSPTDSSALPSNSATNTPTTDPPPGPPRTIDYVDCAFYGLNFQVPEEDVRNRIPAAYEVGSSGGLVQAGLFLERCASVILNNQTILEDVGWGRTFVRVGVNESMAGNALGQLYLLELFVTNDALRQAFQDHGFETTLAEIEVDIASPTPGATVSVGGTLWYESIASQDQGSPEQTNSPLRNHQLGADGKPRWFDEKGSLAGPDLAGTAILQAHGGVLSDIRPTDQAANAAVSTVAVANGRLDMGQPQST